jgi:hypothetical protein
MTASTVPTSTVSPSGTRICVSVPEPGARHLGVDLVGRDLEQRLVGLDMLALGLQPLRDRPLGHGDAHLRHDDVDGGFGSHGDQYSASSRSPAATSSTCGMNAFSSGGENGTGVSARRCA